MKIKSILLAGLIALGFAACNNEDTPQVNNAEATVSVKVIPSSNGTTVRAVEDLTGNGVLAAGLTAESKIQQLEVYVFDAITNVLDGYKSASDAAGVTEVKEIEVTPGNKVIMIVANGAVGTKATKTDLLDATKELPAAADKLPMTGESATITLDPGQNYYGYPADQTPEGKEHSVAAPLKIQRINARVAIVAADVSQAIKDGDDPIFDELKDVDVAIFNVPKASKLFGAVGTLATNTDYLFGEAWPTTANSYVVGTAETTFKDAAVDFPITVAKAPTYYVTENTSAVTTPDKEQMLIVLRGKPYKGGNQVTSEGLYTDAAGYTYYPIWVNKDGDITGSDGDGKILRNTQYNISLTITKIGNPTIDEVEDAWLDVVVEVMDWAVVGQDVTWE